MNGRTEFFVQQLREWCERNGVRGESKIAFTNMTKKHPGMARLRCTNLTCGKYYYSYDRQRTWCYACRNNPKLKEAAKQLFAANRAPRQSMTAHDRDELLKQIPF